MEKKEKKSLGFVLLFLRGEYGKLTLAVFATAFSIVFSFLIPQIIRFTVDLIIGDGTSSLPAFVSEILEALGGRGFFRGNLLIVAAAIVGSALLAGVFNYFSRVNISKGTEGFVKKMRDALFSHIQTLPFSWHTENQTGDIIQRCTSDVETVKRFVSQQLGEVIRTVILLVTALWLMFSMHVKLAFICLSTIPVIVLYSLFFFGRISRQFLKVDEAEGELTVQAQENLTGVRVVRAFGREKYERERFEKKNQTYANLWIRLGYTLGVFWGIGDFAMGGQILLMICFGAYFAARGEMTLGEFLAFYSYTQTIAWPVRSLGRMLSELSKARVAAGRIGEILDAPAEPAEPGAVKPGLNADIRFENVSFSYGEAKILDGLSFTVKSGKTLGILGPTGSGKSTITYLLNRLYDIPEGSGRITIGGTDIRDIDKARLRRGVGLVLQEPFLFSKSIRDNISVAAPDATLEEIRAAASVSDLDGSIMEFPKGYDTIVGERGVTLSGGQKQRVAIARTLITNPPILVFDDSMSAVDMETDARIREALRHRREGTTAIIISHRINTLMEADSIIVLENGRVAAEGTHAELIAKDGAYRRVYDLQSDAGMIAKGGG